MKTIAIVIRGFPDYVSGPVWFPITIEAPLYEGAIREAEEILKALGEDVALTYTGDFDWLEKHNYTRI